jgi:hypothetical protein
MLAYVCGTLADFRTYVFSWTVLSLSSTQDAVSFVVLDFRAHKTELFNGVKILIDSLKSKIII